MGTTVLVLNRNFGVLFVLWLKVFGGFQMNLPEILKMDPKLEKLLESWSPKHKRTGSGTQAK
jgi:hypothetical protein